MSTFPPTTDRLQRRLHRRDVRGVPARSGVGGRVLAPILPHRRVARRAVTGGGRQPTTSLLRKTAGAAALLGAIQRVRPSRRPARSARHAAAGRGGADAGIPRHHRSRSRRRPGVRARLRRRGTAADVIQRHARASTAARIGATSSSTSATKRSASGSARTIESGAITQPLTDDEKKRLLRRLTEVDGLERFLGRAYVSVKRFSIEGTDALVPMLDEAIARAARARRAARS